MSRVDTPPVSRKPSTESSRPLPSEGQVAEVFRRLSDAYSDERARATRGRTWQRIELKQSLSARLRRGPWMPPGTGRARLASYFLAALAMTVLCVFLLWPESGRLEYTHVGGVVQFATPNESRVTTDTMPAKLAFSDGSLLEVKEASDLSISALGRHSALSRLARGSVKVSVQHHEDTRWTFLAGPYEVRVEGTSFDLSWADDEFALAMHEGRVRVLGPDHGEWVLYEGDSLVIPREHHAAAAKLPAANAPEQDGASDAAEADPAAERSGAEGTSDGSDGAGLEGKAQAGRAWGKLLTEGRFADILADARQQGTGAALRRPLGDVVALAHAARYENQSDLAEDCWKTVRSRAPGSSNAQQGAFFLGRIMEQQGRRADAVQWYRRYQNESPGGVYAGQALGRELVLTSGQGKSGAAADLAREYMRRYPSGPYANAAKAALGQRDPASGVSGGNDAISAE